MADQVEIEFYLDSDEVTFLESWEDKYGELNEEQLEKLYQEIAQDIESKYQSGEHQLGKSFSYKEVKVGYSDYSTFNNWFLFSAAKR
ncbi:MULTISPECIES: hypothetical protein [Carnobacterium]|jgi:cystine transport system permease protein|uniref:Cystine transport system permease protein n=1 Tax=Carnobacterium alterfunditum TaxID=28230 RepID=A0A1N6HZX3_9LACT|nr:MULTISPECIES: hypothetical protein [Carnobacterium]MBT2731949.1 hypothetical protein [Carnobacterium sp. ISL-102]SIO25368.1 cystine transport system permease protein [Carnobacterium alterfunditum]